MRFRTAAVMLLWLLASTFAAGANQNTDPVARPRRPNPNVLQAFDDLLRRLEDIKRGELTHGQKTSLFVKVAAARHHYKKKHVCPSSHLLQIFLDETQRLRLRRRRAALAEELYADGRSLRDLVILQADRRSSCADASVGRPPMVELLASDNEHLSARVRFGSPKLASVKAGDESWTQMSLPGIENVVGPSGQPSLPSWQALVGIPSGSQLRLPAVQTRVRERIGLNLYPFQQQAADQVRDPRFGDEPPRRTTPSRTRRSSRTTRPTRRTPSRLRIRARYGCWASCATCRSHRSSATPRATTR